MNKLESILSRISRKSTGSKVNGVSKTERIMAEIADKMDAEKWGKFENVKCEVVFLSVPNEAGVAITPGEYNGTSVVLFEGDASNSVLLTGLHDPISDNQAATKGYVDPRLLPIVTSEDAGRVLMVDSSGNWVLSDK